MIKVFGLRHQSIGMIPTVEYIAEVEDNKTDDELIDVARKFTQQNFRQYAAVIITTQNEETHCYNFV